MNDDLCQQYMENPAANAAHLESCVHCQQMEEELEALDRTMRKGNMDDGDRAATLAAGMPLAGWEGASHKAWPVVIVAGVFILVIAAVAFAVVGIPPIAGLSSAAQGQLSSGATLLGVARSFGALVLRAPVAFHVVVITAFVTVNLVLFLLLRRPPRGIDV